MAVTPQAAAAAGRLLGHASWLQERSLKSEATAWQKVNCTVRANHLQACAALILSPTRQGDVMRARLEEVDAFSLGWKGLSEWVTLLAGETFRTNAGAYE